MPDAGEVVRLGAAGVGVAHCPSSNLILASGIAPVVGLRAAGVAVGLGVDGSSSADAASLWLEARQAMLLAKLRDGAGAMTARTVLEMATIGGAACLGRAGELGQLVPGAVGDLAVWSLDGPRFAGAVGDPIEAWLRCGPAAARDTDRARTRHRRRGSPGAPGTRGAPARPPLRGRTHADWSAMSRVRIAVIGAALLLAACSADRDPAVAPTSTTDGLSLAPPPPSTVPAIPIDSVAMVGDSITVGSKDALVQQFATLGLDSVFIDAQGGRRMVLDATTASGLAAVSAILDEEPPDLWVIALGTNDVAAYGPDEYRPAINELLDEVPADAPVVWVDTYLDEFQDESAAFNDELRAALAERGLTTVVDWAEIAAEDGVLFDGVHPSGYGIEQFASRVTGAVDDWMA